MKSNKVKSGYKLPDRCDSVEAIMSAINNLKDSKGKYVGSGFRFNVTDLSGNQITDVVINGEDTDEIINEMIKSLNSKLNLKARFMTNELNRINSFIEDLKKYLLQI